MRRTITSISSLIFAILLLAGCASVAPLQQDQPIVLGKGQGVAAVVFKTPDPVSDVYIMPANGGGQPLEIGSVPRGDNMYLFIVPAGRYCFQQFNYQSIEFYSKGNTGMCFNVGAGQLGYSGEVEPVVSFSKVMMHQQFDVPALNALLRSKYPKVAAQFLPAESNPTASSQQPAASSPQAAQPEAAPADQGKANVQCNSNKSLCVWSVNNEQTRAQSVMMQNNTKWMLIVTDFELYDCINIKEACEVKQPKITVPPNSTKLVMTVNPAVVDEADGYQIRYQYGYEIVHKKAKKH